MFNAMDFKFSWYGKNHSVAMAIFYKCVFFVMYDKQ